MSTTLRIISLALILADLAFCLWIGFKKKKEVNSTEEYFIAGKKTGAIMLFLTIWASMSGAGNFIGQAGRGALLGVSAYWQWMGDGVLGGLVFGLIIAPHLAKFGYISMPHYISGYLCNGDPTVRRIAGFANLLPNICWAGSQIMGMSYVISTLMGVPYTAAVVITGIVFVTYTALGGVGAVIVADALHGTIQLFFSAAVIVFGLKTFNFDFSVLQANVVAIDAARWSLSGGLTNIQKVTALLTGFVGVMSNPIVWNRAFCSASVKSARKSFGWHAVFYLVLIFVMITIGISGWTINQQAGDQTLVWLIVNKMPGWVSVFLGVGVYAACMSAADTHLNASAANIVCDIMDPTGKLVTTQVVKYSQISTVCAGVFTILSGLFFESIYDLANLGYAVCGGVMIPIFVIGLMHRDRTSEEYKSTLSIHAAKVAMVVGIIACLITEFVPALSNFFGGGVIPAIVVTVITYYVVPKKAK